MTDNISEERLAGCALGGALAVTAFISDAVTVIHAPKGCAHQAFSMFHALMADANLARVPPILVSNMGDREVIFGGEEALRNAISKAATTATAVTARAPQLIAVVTSCVPETIGDDVEGVCSTHAEAERIVYIPASGFLGGSSETGENIALVSLAKRIEQKPPVQRTAAIIGEKNLETEVEENYAEVVRLLARLSITVILRFCRNITPVDMEKLGEAQFFIFRDERVERAGKAIAKQFNRPYVSEFPRGLSGCIRFLEESGSAAGIPDAEIKAAVLAEEEYQAEQLSKFKELAGMSLSLGYEPFAGCHKVAREAMERLSILESADGVPANLPFYLPVGLSGVLKMMYLWRRGKRT